MVICARLLVPVEMVLRLIVEVIRWVTRTVCEWVSTVITTVKEVCEKVCGWLGPFSFLCDWVCKLVEVVETVWEWVCKEVLERIVDLIEIIVTYVIYILRWICFLIDLPIRLLRLLWCFLGFQSTKFLRVCVVILADEDGGEVLSQEDAQNAMAEAARIFRQCNINLIVDDVQVVRQPRFLDGTSCDFGGIFSAFFIWFSRNARPDCVTVYFVNSIQAACGCAYPGTSWVTVAAPGPNCSDDNLGCVIAQEIGHLADIWPHSDDTGNNVMANPCGPNFTRAQCCIIRTSRIVTNTPSLFLDLAFSGTRFIEPIL